ncbi:GFA family protein [Microbulbifer sp. VTAC004]
MPITGEYFCGDIQYRVNGKLRDSKSCHCSRCRKAFSSSASALVDPDEFEWLSGESLLTSFVGKHGYGFHYRTASFTLPIKSHGFGVLGHLPCGPSIK